MVPVFPLATEMLFCKTVVLAVGAVLAIVPPSKLMVPPKPSIVVELGPLRLMVPPLMAMLPVPISAVVRVNEFAPLFVNVPLRAIELPPKV